MQPNEDVNSLPPLDSLKCNLCKNYLTKPLTLSCLHSFCTKCLLNAHGAEEDQLEDFLIPVEISAQANNDKNKKADAGGKIETPAKKSSESEKDNKQPSPPGSVEVTKPLVKEPKRLSCPTCINHLHIPKDDDEVVEPFPNARLERIVKLVHETPILCQNCKENESEIKCETCNAYWYFFFLHSKNFSNTNKKNKIKNISCRPCWTVTHSAAIFVSHKATPLKHSEMSALPKCTQHMLNDQEFFVTEEEVGTCFFFLYVIEAH